MSRVIMDSTKEVQDLAREYPEGVIVSYSGGKDSMVILKMASMFFRRVVGCNFYFVKGLKYEDELILRGTEVCPSIEWHRYPHWAYWKYLSNGVFNLGGYYNVPDLQMTDIWDMCRQDTGLRLVINGAKLSDGVMRKNFFGNIKDSHRYEHVKFPLKHWRKQHVLAYIAQHKLHLAELSASAKVSSGVGLSNECILWLYDKHREDYERVRAVFPLIEAVVARREFYGVTA